MTEIVRPLRTFAKLRDSTGYVCVGYSKRSIDPTGHLKRADDRIPATTDRKRSGSSITIERTPFSPCSFGFGRGDWTLSLG